MKKFFILITAIFLLNSCGTTTSEMRKLEFNNYTFTKNSDEVKVCLLDKLSDFRPDRMLINHLSNYTEIFLGAEQFGKFRNFYLFNITKNKVTLSYYSLFIPLSLEEADSYIKSCI